MEIIFPIHTTNLHIHYTPIAAIPQPDISKGAFGSSPAVLPNTPIMTDGFILARILFFRQDYFLRLFLEISWHATAAAPPESIHMYRTLADSKPFRRLAHRRVLFYNIIRPEYVVFTVYAKGGEISP